MVRAQCDGDGEHGFVVSIETLDNPGWGVKVDPVDTDVEERPFEPLVEMEDEREWVRCEVRDGRIDAVGGPRQLGRIVRTFLDGAQQP